MCESHSVGGLGCGVVAVRQSYAVHDLQCEAFVVSGSCGVWEL